MTHWWEEPWFPAAISAAAALLGGIVGAALQGRSSRRLFKDQAELEREARQDQLTHDREMRFLDDRRSTYSAFSDAASDLGVALLMHPQVTRANEIKTLQSAFASLSMLATKPVLDAASRVMLRALGENLTANEAFELSDAFRESARIDLGVGPSQAEPPARRNPS